jgi:branched-chain amino acid transport system ATP-binding protein
MPDEIPAEAMTRAEVGEVPVLADLRSTTPRQEETMRVLADVPHEPGAGKPDPILVTDHVLRRFGGLTAVDVGHVEVQRGSITALIGPNGAGKTTFFNLLTGFDRPDQGSWTFNGRSLAGTPAYKVARGGMVRTFQLTKALAKLTVIENMRLGAIGQRGESVWRAMFPGFWRGQEDDITARAEDLLARFSLDTKRDDFAGSLSGGQRKLLEMARALMVEPEMVMLDEPMAGDISDWVLVMAQGKVIAEGPPDAVMSESRVIDAYLGAHHDQTLLDESVVAEIEQEAAAELAAEQTGAASEEEDR